MNEEEKEKISQILVSKEKQIEIDAIRMVEQYDIEDKEEAYKSVREYLESQMKRILSNR